MGAASASLIVPDRQDSSPTLAVAAAMVAVGALPETRAVSPVAYSTPIGDQRLDLRFDMANGLSACFIETNPGDLQAEAIAVRISNQHSRWLSAQGIGSEQRLAETTDRVSEILLSNAPHLALFGSGILTRNRWEESFPPVAIYIPAVGGNGHEGITRLVIGLERDYLELEEVCNADRAGRIAVTDWMKVGAVATIDANAAAIACNCEIAVAEIITALDRLSVVEFEGTDRHWHFQGLFRWQGNCIVADLFHERDWRLENDLIIVDKEGQLAETFTTATSDKLLSILADAPLLASDAVIDQSWTSKAKLFIKLHSNVLHVSPDYSVFASHRRDDPSGGRPPENQRGWLLKPLSNASAYRPFAFASSRLASTKA